MEKLAKLGWQKLIIIAAALDIVLGIIFGAIFKAVPAGIIVGVLAAAVTGVWQATQRVTNTRSCS